ncbi:MAG: succinate dehydrogenase assembly factor 2 [Hyphomicrobium sp.]
MSDDLDLRRRRATYRAAHRGTKELDALIGRYAAARLPAFSIEALEHFERLLATPDPTLQAWIFAHEDASATEFFDVVADIRAFHGLDALVKAGS